MQKSVQFFLGILAGLCIAGLAVILSVFLWDWRNPVSLTLPAPAAALPLDLAAVTGRVAQLEAEQAYQLKVFEWKLDQKLLVLGWTALFISFVAAFVGLKTYNDLDKVIREKVNAVLEKELYQLDPTNLQIWVISRDEEQKLFDPKKKEDQLVHLGVEMAKVLERLKLSGLHNVHTREDLDKKNYRGVTIVPVLNGDMEKRFIDYLERNRTALDKERAAFVLYTQTHLVSKETLSSYSNLATANMPATAASMVLTVGRGLKSIQSQTEKEGV